MNTARAIYGLIACLLTCAMVSTAGTQAGSEGPPQEPSDMLRDGRALAEFVNHIVTNRMQQAHVPGAVVTIVKGDRVIFNKGYGFANLDHHTPVDPEQTLFRVASVSKVFNAMAVMRLVDQGLVGVDEDVRPHLATAGLQLDNSAYGPVTLRALLTHTAGIRDLSIPNVTSTTDAGQVLPLGSYLQKCLPLRWQEPGETVLYTDHGSALAGYVVERLSKTRFQEAVGQRVMRPLGMSHTYYAVPEEQLTNLAVAYTYGNSGYQATPFRYINYDPAVGVITTGSDMARLMICHLSGCKGFLKDQTVKLMHQPQHADDARLGAQWTCGFFLASHSREKEPYLFHYGGAYNFQSVLGISLSRRIGVFVAQNLGGSRVFQLTDILDRLSGEKIAAEPARQAQSSAAVAGDLADIKTVVGTYVSDRTLSRGIKIPKEEYVYVRYVEGIKGIEVEYWPTRENPMRLTQVAPLLFRSVKGDEQLAFRTSQDGKRTYLIDYNMRGDGAFRRVSLSDRPSVP